MVAVFLELFAEVVVGNFSGFLESAPGFSHFGVAASIMDDSVEVVLCDDTRWDLVVLVSDVLFAAWWK